MVYFRGMRNAEKTTEMTQLTNNQVLAEISTHKAVKNGQLIDIYIKGLDFEDLHYDDELINTIRLEDKDDLFAIFERYEEDNRINAAEFVNAMS